MVGIVSEVDAAHGNRCAQRIKNSVGGASSGTGMSLFSGRYASRMDARADASLRLILQRAVPSQMILRGPRARLPCGRRAWCGGAGAGPSLCHVRCARDIPRRCLRRRRCALPDFAWRKISAASAGGANRGPAFLSIPINVCSTDFFASHARWRDPTAGRKHRR